MKKILMILVIFSLGVVLAQAEMIKLKDGTVINGSIVEQTSEYIVIESSLGKLKIQKYQLASIDYDGSQSVPQGQSSIIINNSSQGDNIPQINSEKNDSLAMLRIEKILKKGKLHKSSHRLEVQRLLNELPTDYNRILYSRYKKKGFLKYSAFNIPIIPVGSIMQGDFWGVALISMGYFSAYRLVSNYNYYAYDPYDSYGYYDYYGTDYFSIGIALAATTFVYSLVRPLIYQVKSNKNLKRALFATTTVSRGDVHQIYTHNDNVVDLPLYSLSF